MKQKLTTLLLTFLALFAPSIAQAIEINIGDTAKTAGVPGSADYSSSNPEAGFGALISRILTIALTIGALIAFLNLIWGGIQWISSGGDKAKVESARDRITQSIIGLIILASVLAIFSMLQNFLGLKVLTF